MIVLKISHFGLFPGGIQEDQRPLYFSAYLSPRNGKGEKTQLEEIFNHVNKIFLNFISFIDSNMQLRRKIQVKIHKKMF